MRANKDFFDRLRDEVNNVSAPEEKKEKSGVSIESILKGITWYTGDNLDQYLKSIDWFSVNPEDIIPRPKLRNFAKQIYKLEQRLQVLKFLRKYKDYYFGKFWGMPFWGGYPSVDFEEELNILIEQIESDGEFSTGKIDSLNAQVISLQNKNKELENKIKEKDQEIALLKAQIDIGDIKCVDDNRPSLEAIREYAKKVTPDEVKTIQHMLFSTIKTITEDVRQSILAIEPVKPTNNVFLGDNVQNKYVEAK